MTFAEAVRSGFDHYVKFDGRASRPAFWWWFLFGILVGIGAAIIDAIIGSFGVVSGLAGLALLLPNLSVAIRRLHDTDHTGWWVLIGLIPIIGFIVLLIFYLRQSDPGENRYGPPPAEGVAAPTAA
ncbi:MAG TPA: DUF805 domain-containing protein [Solirubrobacterales bacterium]|nr:DUF805 domain-containing protein [Solirubrobacterales bacterium]